MEGIIELFINWTKKKIQYHVNKEKKGLFFHQGQDWWAALGQNIGFEMDGKNEEFHRPVLILKKYNAKMCLVVPLTTKMKHPPVWYHVSVPGGDRPRVANITQGRTISSKRLLRKESTLEKKYLEVVSRAFKKQFI